MLFCLAAHVRLHVVAWFLTTRLFGAFIVIPPQGRYPSARFPFHLVELTRAERAYHEICKQHDAAGFVTFPTTRNSHFE